MTPSEIESAARNRYNAVGDSFWSQAELFDLITDACHQLGRLGMVIERTYTTTTVAGTQGYTFPTNVIALKRVTYDGMKLAAITMREDDAITGLNMTTTEQGTPNYYWTWDYTIYLRPIPSSALTLKLWTYNSPSAISSTSTLEVPEIFHHRIVNYLVSMMAAKDSNLGVHKIYNDLWKEDILEARKWIAKRKRTDGYAIVNDEAVMAESYVGKW